MTPSPESHIAGVILAAGGSRRLGRPKQLVELPSGRTLLQHTIACFQAANIDTFVVTGAAREQVEKDIDTSRCTIVHNDNWEEGMASSIRCGIKTVNARDATHVILSVVDQLHLNADILRRIVEISGRHPGTIVTCRYGNGVPGPPTLFPRKYFPDLLQLRGDGGARSVVSQHEAIAIDFEGGELDVDHAEDVP